jgi:AcrR family transcriptional regulator
MERLASQSSERGWILIGMAQSCAVGGYEATTIEDVCAAAGLARKTFEREFADLGECLGAAMESVVAETWLALERALGPGRSWDASLPWGDGLRAGTEALLQSLAERPDFANLALVEAPMAGGRAGALAASSKTALLDYLERGHHHAEPAVPAGAARGALAGAEGLVRGRVLAGEAERLPDLLPDLVYMLAVPFLGMAEARRLADDPEQRRLRAVA